MSDLDKYQQQAHQTNTRNKVFHDLDSIMRNPVLARKRWVWELLQNALDAWHTCSRTDTGGDSADTGGGLNVSIEHTSVRGLTFKYDGHGFTMENVAHLIYSGTTKIDDLNTTGQFGTGFITTHLLSSAIHVSGQINHPGESHHGKSFQFCLERKFNSSAEDIETLMNQAWSEFEDSLSEIKSGCTVPTMFRYFPIENEAKNAVQIGITELKRSAPFLVAFNEGFSKINFKSDDETVSFSVTKREDLPRENGLPKITEITVSEEIGGKTAEERRFLLVEDAETCTSVGMPTRLVSGIRECIDVAEKTPRLFRGFPLVETDEFSFSAVINSRLFTPLETRDGVQLNEAEANRGNWQAIKAACELLVGLLKYAASMDWSNVSALADIPNIVSREWINGDMLRKKLSKQFIEEVRQSSVVILDNCNAPASPEESVLPFSQAEDTENNKNNVESLWGLLNDMREKHEKLPKKVEAFGWFRAIKSWGDVSDEHSNIGFNCQKLAEEIHNAQENDDTAEKKSLGEVLQLQKGIDPIEWLNRFHALIDQENLRDKVNDRCIVLAQDGQLRKLSELHRDAGVADELKDIAELLAWRIRGELRDTRIGSLAEESGAGEWGNEYVVKQLIEKLRARRTESPDDDFAKASVGVFKWVANQKDWNLLDNFPAFAAKDRDDEKKIITLQKPQEAEEYLHLAPIRSWPKDLQPYSDLFPGSHILDSAFFEAVPDAHVWQTLHEEGFVKNSVIIKEIKEDILPISCEIPESEDDDVKHVPANGVVVTNVALLDKIMKRVPNSQKLARLFWRFLTDGLLKLEPDALQDWWKCVCDKEHRYPVAAWLEPVQEKEWVPAEKNKKNRANAASLGNLFRGEPEAMMPTNTKGFNNILEAIGVPNPASFRFELYDSEKQKIAINLMDSENPGAVREIIEDLKDDPHLYDYLKDRRKQKQTAQKNRLLGNLVEESVRKILESKNFKVCKIHKGADLEISPDSEIGDVATLELTSPGEDQTWLIEVKSTRSNGEVKMTITQAEKARKNKKRYLLCVVPIDDAEPTENIVQEKMWFVQDIGDRVAPLCDKFDGLKDQMDDITEEIRGVQLSISSGTERVLVKNSVWKETGFPLDELAKKLKS